MARNGRRALPKYLERHPLNQAFYYKHPGMPRKANLGKDANAAIQLAHRLNSKYRIELEQKTVMLEATLDLRSPQFAVALQQFVEKYIRDYRLKSSTARRLVQRQGRLIGHLGALQVAAIDTEMMRQAVSSSSQFEQSKTKTLLLRFFQYAKSTGAYPAHLVNPAHDLFIDPVPPKQRQRMTLEQFRAIYARAPDWLQWLMTLGFHLALRRIDLVNLRFDDIVGDRIISPIRKTDSEARDIEPISVDFPIHPDVRRVVAEARRSSLQVGRCPFIVHRAAARRTKRAADALITRRLEHHAQILPEYASKAFDKARAAAIRTTGLFEGLTVRQLPTLHEIRALSSYLYANAGYDVSAVQDLMAHTDPDMTRAYQKGHARKLLRIEMSLPFSVVEESFNEPSGVREPRTTYASPKPAQEKFSKNFLRADSSMTVCH